MTDWLWSRVRGGIVEQKRHTPTRCELELTTSHGNYNLSSRDSSVISTLNHVSGVVFVSFVPPSTRDPAASGHRPIGSCNPTSRAAGGSRSVGFRKCLHLLQLSGAPCDFYSARRPGDISLHARQNHHGRPTLPQKARLERLWSFA